MKSSGMILNHIFYSTFFPEKMFSLSDGKRRQKIFFYPFPARLGLMARRIYWRSQLLDAEIEFPPCSIRALSLFALPACPPNLQTYHYVLLKSSARFMNSLSESLSSARYVCMTVSREEQKSFLHIDFVCLLFPSDTVYLSSGFM